jgi:iron complex transport system substrate-binding protein
MERAQRWGCPRVACFAMVMLALLLSIRPVGAETITVETARGPEEVPASPGSIVALDVAIIDMLAALGVQPKGVPAPHFVSALEGAVAEVAMVGSLHEPDYEALARLAPDLIIAGGRSSTKLDALSRIAPTIDMTVWGEPHVEQSLAWLAALGQITGRETKAAAIAAAFRARLEQARQAVAGKGDALIVMANGPKLSAFGSGSRFGWLHTALGLPEAAPGVDPQTHGEAISFEFVAEVDPDWLLVIDRGAAIGAGGESAAQTLDNALVAGTEAWQSGQLVFLDAADVYVAGSGISAMTRTLDRLIAAFSASG